MIPGHPIPANKSLTMGHLTLKASASETIKANQRTKVWWWLTKSKRCISKMEHKAHVSTCKVTKCATAHKVWSLIKTLQARLSVTRPMVATLTWRLMMPSQMWPMTQAITKAAIRPRALLTRFVQLPQEHKKANSAVIIKILLLWRVSLLSNLVGKDPPILQTVTEGFRSQS